jgi:RHS repeat-associated protein
MRGFGRRGLIISRTSRRQLPLILCVALVAVYAPISSFAVTTPVNAAAAPNLPAGQQATGAPKQLAIDPTLGDIPSLRTQMSRTSYSSRGEMRATIWASPVNYRDGAGAWQPIDDSLVASPTPGYAGTNKADQYVAQLPFDLASMPVTVEEHGVTVALKLRGASSATIATSGDSATYAGVLPSTSVRYSATPDGLHEYLTLADGAAPQSFSYDVSVSGATARDEAGGVAFVDTKGSAILHLLRPVITDAAGATSATAATMSLTGTGVTYVATVSLDPAWLNSPSRAWPVTVDPDVAPTLARSCALQSGSPSTTFCGQTSLNAGFDGTNKERSLLYFDVQSALPSTQLDITKANLTLCESSRTQSTNTALTVNALTRAYNGSATWNTYDGTNSWTTGGGDYTTTNAYALSSVGAAGSCYSWTPLSMVQAWAEGSIPNDGLLLKEPTENVNQVYYFWSSTSATPPGDSPNLQIYYESRAGSKSNYTQIPIRINDRTGIKINPATGNMLLTNTDFNITGTGIPLVITRTFNSLPYLSNWFGLHDSNWSSSETDYNTTTSSADNSFFLEAGNDANYVFGKTADNASTWLAPPAANLTPSGGPYSYTLKYNSNGATYATGSSGQLISYKDKNGNTVSLNVTMNGSQPIVNSETDSQARQLTWTWDSNHRPTQIKDSTGRIAKYNWNATTGQMATFVDTNFGTTTYGYYGNDGPGAWIINQIDTPEGRRTVLNYDTSGRLTSLVQVTDKTHNTGPTWGFAYSPDSGAASGHTVVTDPNSHQTTYYYDTHSQVTKVTDALGHSRQSGYTPNGDANLLTGANSASDVTTLNYSSDGKNNLMSYQEPATASGQSAATTTYTYNAPNQSFYPSTKTDAQSNCQSFTYDTAGNLTDVFDGRSSSCTAGNQWQSRYKGDPGVTCAYQASAGELCYTQDPKSNRTNYAYDTEGNLTAVHPPSPLGSTVITVDAVSRISTVTDGKGQTTTYSYDNLDRITQILYSGTTTCASYSTCTVFNYDGDGNVKSRTDATGTTTFTYDFLNRLRDKSSPSSFACSGSSPTGITFNYDLNSNLTSYCDAGGTTAYGYDAGNNLIALAEPGGSVNTDGTCGSPPCTSFKYDNDNRRELTTFPGGAKLTAAYDGAGNENSVVGTSAASTILSSFTYTYTVGTTDKQLRQTMNDNTTTWAYSYDASNRLTDAVPGSGTTYHYRYDANGNRCRVDSNPCGTSSPPDSYAYNAANELCYSGATTTGTCASPPAGSTTYTYDANGNLTASSVGGSLAYNSKNQSTSITYNGSTLSSMAYADVNQSERTAAGSTTYMSDSFGPVATQVSGTNSYVIRDNTGEILGERIAGISYYFLKDGIGSVVAVISGNGATLANTYRYDPFGSPASSSQTVTDPWQYATGYLDSTGLYKFGTRYYDRATGRWTQQDPVAGAVSNPASLNRYAYVNGNPVNYNDPAGASIGVLGFNACFFICVTGGLTQGFQGGGGFHPYIGFGFGNPGIGGGATFGAGTSASGWSGSLGCSWGPFAGSLGTGGSATVGAGTYASTGVCSVEADYSF